MSLKFYQNPFAVTHPPCKASKMAVKVDLCIFITAQVAARGWTQIEAAKALKITQPRVSAIKNLKIDQFTIDALLDIVDLLDARTEISRESTFKVEISIPEGVDEPSS